MKKISIKEIVDNIHGNYKIIGTHHNYTITNVKDIKSADKNSLVWVSPSHKNKHLLVEHTLAKTIICDNSLDISEELKKIKCFIVVDSPRLVFINIVAAFFSEKVKHEIHPSAIIHPEAQIHPNTYIGPHTYIGKSQIGEGTIIYGNVYVYDKTKIGMNVIIHAGCVIGADGFGFERDAEGRLHKFPHIGGVILEDEVELQAMTHVSRGTLDNTIIGKGSKFDSCCHIAHNDIIGENNIIAAHTMFSGSVKVGNNCFIGPSSIFRDLIEIGNESFIGIGTYVSENLSDKSFVMGNPAKPVDDYRKLINILERLIEEESHKIT